MADGNPVACPVCSSPLAADGLCFACALGGAGAGSQGNPGSRTTVLRQFASYELIGEIGQEGAMGSVFYARQRGAERVVALKMLRPERMRSLELVDRFQLEARAAARLDHPNILPVYEVGQADGVYFFSMKLAMGGSLRWQMKNGGWDVPASDAAAALRAQRRIADLVRKVALGVQHAHERGILHRDLKPANILLDLDGTPYIADFGLAKDYGSDAGLTQSFAMLGTPAYMAPEQGVPGGHDVTTATDVWALGVTLYELLAGKPPFEGASAWELVQNIQLREPVPPSRSNPLIDLSLEAICLRCLRKDAFLRYHTAAALAEDLDRFLAGDTVKPKPAKTPSSEARSPEAGVRRQVRRLAFFVFLQSAALAGVLLFPRRVLRWSEPTAQPRADLIPVSDGRFTNSLGMIFVDVKGLDVQFCIWETRVQDYRNYDNNSDYLAVQPRKPISNVSWNDAVRFAEWLTRTEHEKGTTPSGRTYRLPTDLEWSAAVGLPKEIGATPSEKSRNAPANQYPWGGSWPPERTDGNYSWMAYADREQTTPALAVVGNSKPNAFGIYDLGGNVWEMCSDNYSVYGDWKVTRGGSFLCDGDEMLLSTKRVGVSTGRTSEDLGFRLVLTR